MTEEYNGYFMDSWWKFRQQLDKFIGGAGTQTARFSFWWSYIQQVVSNTNTTEEYDGSTWTGGGNMGTTR
jgi:hypothetical protein